MAFRRCPDCGAEWWNEETCTDCGATLVDIPDEADDDVAGDRRVTRSIPTSAELDQMPRPRLARFLGFFVDYLILTLVLVALGALTSESKVRIRDGERIRGQVIPAWVLVVYGIFILLYAVITVARMQRTPGMIAAGIGVERVTPEGDVTTLSWPVAAVRGVIAMGWFALPPLLPQDSIDGALASALSWLVILWPMIVFAPILIDPDRRGLHDLLLSTRVVRRPGPQWASGITALATGRRRRDADG